VIDPPVLTDHESDELDYGSRRVGSRPQIPQTRPVQIFLHSQLYCLSAHAFPCLFQWSRPCAKIIIIVNVAIDPLWGQKSKHLPPKKKMLIFYYQLLDH
jgi:hypothetical protein